MQHPVFADPVPVVPACPAVPVRDDAERMRGLWVAVLVEQLRLAFSGTTCRHRRSAASAARIWIGSADFHTVCDLAGVEGEALVRGLGRLRQGTGLLDHMRSR